MASHASRCSSTSSWSSSNAYLTCTNLNPDVESEFRRHNALTPEEREQEIFNRVVHPDVQEKFAYIRQQMRPPFGAFTVPKQTRMDIDCFLGSDERRIVIAGKNESKEIQAFKKAETVKVLKKDAAANAKVMLVSVVIFGGLGSLGWIASPLGGIIGTPVGVGTGLVVGGLIVKHLVNEQVNIGIELSDHYLAWKNKAIATKVYPIFRNFIDADNVFRELLCPIANDICSIPVKCPNNHVYNQESIFAYIKKSGIGKPKKINCPFGGKPFGKKDLMVDSDYCQKLIAKAREVSCHILQIGRENEILHGVDAVIANTEELMGKISDELVGQLSVQYNRAVREGKMTREKANKNLERSISQWTVRKNEVAKEPADFWDVVMDFFS